MPVGEIASWAEIVSALAIVFSLLFVGYEVAQNNKLSKIQQHQSNLTHLSAFKSCLVNSEIADVVARGRESYRALNTEERLIFRSFMEISTTSIIGIRVFAGQSSLGRENAIDYTSREMRNTLDHPGAREWWADCRETVPLGPPGRKELDRLIGENADKPYPAI